jgi:hypothetical protein
VVTLTELGNRHIKTSKNPIKITARGATRSGVDIDRARLGVDIDPPDLMERKRASSLESPLAVEMEPPPHLMQRQDSVVAELLSVSVPSPSIKKETHPRLMRRWGTRSLSLARDRSSLLMSPTSTDLFRRKLDSALDEGRRFARFRTLLLLAAAACFLVVNALVAKEMLRGLRSGRLSSGPFIRALAIDGPTLLLLLSVMPPERRC